MYNQFHQALKHSIKKIHKTTSGYIHSSNKYFVRFGFRSCVTNETVQSQCVVCGEILVNERLKPPKLK